MPKNRPRNEAEPEPERDDAGWLTGLRPQDFDGHSGFDKFTAAQRLGWLQRSADLIRDFVGAAARPRGNG